MDYVERKKQHSAFHFRLKLEYLHSVRRCCSMQKCRVQNQKDVSTIFFFSKFIYENSPIETNQTMFDMMFE